MLHFTLLSIELKNNSYIYIITMGDKNQTYQIDPLFSFIEIRIKNGRRAGHCIDSESISRVNLFCGFIP